MRDYNQGKSSFIVREITIAKMNRLSIEALTKVNAVYGYALAAVFALALFLRTYFPYDNVFTGDWVRFKWYDSWYHIRLVENLVQHFPSRIQFDPYTAYPYGQDVFFAPFPDYLLGFFIWFFGAGSPSQELIETLGAYFPAVLGAFVTIPVFFIGKELFNKKVGLLAAALVMILPGQFLMKSLLGFTDHHVAETLFSSLTILFLILALKSSKQTDVSFDSLRTREWKLLKKPLIYSLLTGIALGLYLLSWSAGAFFIFILLIFPFLLYMSDHLRRRSTDYISIIYVPALLIALIMVLPFLGQFGMGELQIAALLLGIFGLPFLSAISLLLAGRGMRRVYYPLVLGVLLGISSAILYLVSPTSFDSVIGEIGRFKPAGGSLTIGEVLPLTLPMAWEEFTTSFYLSLISFVLLTYFAIKDGAADKILLVVWSLSMFLAMFGQNRFAYYFAVNASILTAYLCWETIAFVYTKLILETVRQQNGRESTRLIKKSKRKRSKAGKSSLRTLIGGFPLVNYAYGIIAALILFFLVFYHNIGMATDVANQISAPTKDWYESLVWVKGNTPEPFQDADFYNETYEKPPEGEAYQYPDSAYGVMAWWDYGHWITYIAHRIPNANPHQVGATSAGQFFTAQDDISANRMLDQLGSRYVIIDLATAMHEINPEDDKYGIFHAVIEWAGKEESDFFDLYYLRSESNQLEPVILYYPEYYRAMSTRLYVFEGQEWIPQETTVISWSEKELTDTNGNKIKAKVISDARKASDYESAEKFIDNNPNYIIVGTDQLNSPVPLEKLENYVKVYESPLPVPEPGQVAVSEVKIFEYTP